MTNPTLLVIDDEPAARDLVARQGSRAGFQVLTAAGGREGIARLGEQRVDLVIVDLRMPDVGGLDVLRHIREQAPGCHAVLMTGFGTPESAVEAVKLGAMDYLHKPLDMRRLESLLDSVKDDFERRRRVFEIESELARRLEFHGMIGRSAPMQELFTLLRRLAHHARTALVVGETGSGKELAARALHELGPRHKCRFISVDCSTAAGFPADAASGTTLFLDKVDELPAALQAKLVQLVDATSVHVIAATARDLRAEVAAGRFRGDLLYRLGVVEIRVPALRDRRDDIPYLTAAFMRAYAERAGRPIGGITAGAERVLQSAPWEGNVRELRNIVERACILSDGGPITERELRLALPRETGRGRGDGEPSRADATPLATLSRLERDHVLRALERARGNKKAAAEMLGVSRRAFYRRLERLSLGDTIARRPGRGEDEPAAPREAAHA
jgi:DNA-binding NtrC family response regulator